MTDAMMIASPNFITKTPDGKMNLIGAVEKYFVSYTANANTETKETYIKRYNDIIFPYVDTAMPVSEYDDSIIADLLALIAERSGYTKASVNTDLSHLVYDPCEYYFKDLANKAEDNLWGSADRYKQNKDDDSDAQELLIRKSFTVEEEKRAVSILNHAETQKGEYFGLAVMFYLGTRNNETCGFNFGDIRKMDEHPDCEYLQVYETVKIDSNELKAGGKTYNAPRRLPVMPVLKKLLEKRMEFINSQVTWPIKDPNGKEFKSVNDLPIACRGMNFTVRCKSDDLTAAGREFLHQGLKMQESEVAGVSFYMKELAGTSDDLKEKDVTTYLLRRNMATHLYTCGFSMNDSQYYMGHNIEGTDLKRSDFADDEYLYKLYLKLLRHPLNNISETQMQNYTQSVKDNSARFEDISFIKHHIETDRKGSTAVRIINREADDPIHLKIEADSKLIEVQEEPSPERNETEINIFHQLVNRYSDHRS